MTLSAPHSCANHPGVTTSRSCSSCGRPFCDACLTELAGVPLCGWCRDIRLARYEGRGAGTPVDPARVVLWARIFNAVTMVIGGIGFGWFGFLIASMVIGIARSASPGGASRAAPPAEFGLMAGVAAAAAVAWIAVFLPPLLMLGPGRSWTWTWQLVATIIAGIASMFALSYCGVAFLPLAVILAVFWVRPEVRAYFYRR